MIADDRRSQTLADDRKKGCFSYNRNDRRADRRHTFWSAKTSNIHARVG